MTSSKDIRLKGSHLLLAPKAGGGLVQEGAADADGEWHIVVGGEGHADIDAALGGLLLAADLGGLELHNEGAGSLAAEEDTTAGTAQAVIPVAAEAFLDVPGASLAAASGRHQQLVQRSNSFLEKNTA